MINPLIIFVEKATHSICGAVFIAFTFLVILYSTAEAFSFPEREFFAYFDASYFPVCRHSISAIVSHAQECPTNWTDQVIKFSPFIPESTELVDNDAAGQCREKGNDSLFNERIQELILLGLMSFFFAMIVMYIYARLFYP